MRRIVLTLFVVLVGAGNAVACSCAAVSDARYRRAADAVFAGTVVAISDPNPGPGVSSADPITFTFAVERVAKGATDIQQEVVSARDSASCGCDFAQGGRYVVYATRDGGTLRASACGGSRPLVQGEPPFALRRVAVFGSYADHVTKTIATVRRGEHPGRGALRLLLADGFVGTNGGLATAIPRGTRLVGYRTGGGTVRVTLSRRLARLSGARLRLALAQIVFTASDLPGVRRVLVRTPAGALSGFHRTLTTADFRALS